LYRNYQSLLQPTQMGQVEQDPRHPARARNQFTADDLQALDPGPRAGDVGIENIVVGVDHDDNQVTFQDPKLLPKLFPELYPYGYGAFALWHHKKSLREEGRQDLASYTLREYAKHGLKEDRHKCRMFCEVRENIDATV
ncbi:hypothetical protein BGZ70_003970, partial [Mortierella alpina]